MKSGVNAEEVQENLYLTLTNVIYMEKYNDVKAANFHID